MECQYFRFRDIDCDQAAPPTTVMERPEKKSVAMLWLSRGSTMYHPNQYAQMIIDGLYIIYVN